ncbi:DUF3397 domain-containing protein [Oceanobacillus rekensis]|uniref:DUF3397 domain-containing protein n=1 Tax=Oceanobacillus rekensis TaxID=937927 RepID=UPI000B4387F1|nr:DUF3397 domain-containing protein [Oceanobacillus rekensis]
MFDYIIYFISFFITIPIFATVLVYLLAIKILHRKKLKAVHAAVNWTTVLYVITVAMLFDIIFGHSFIAWMFVTFIISLSVIIIYQWKTHTEVEFIKALRIIWRFSFLLFLMLYVILVFAGILQRIFS